MDEWTQTMLLPPEAVEVRLRVGVVPERDHVQLQVEVVDPATKAVLAMWSRPHVPLDSWSHAVGEAFSKVLEHLGAMIDPF